MNLNELKILIEANQVNEICFCAVPLKNEYIYNIKITTNNIKHDGNLHTGRTHKEKTYSSIDRALKAMVNLGYKGEYRILLEDK